jgi:TolB-like protein/DNA-binding winged helix-turn-helix (wHTH) protein
MLRIGDWRVDPGSGQIERNGEMLSLDVRSMRLLLCLADRAGHVVSIDDLLDHVWAGVSVTPDSVYQAVASLRRLLGDDPRQPTYIATVPRLGYKLVAPVTPCVNQDSVPMRDQVLESLPPSPPDLRRHRVNFTHPIAAMLLLLLGLAAGIFLVRARNIHLSATPIVNSQPQKSIAVLPFLDLTEGMKEEEFADGMTEELINRLSKIPDLRVPPPTSSFFYKGKQVPVAEIAKALGVAYVLDGSVRKSGSRLRVAARLVRADNGYVIWTEAYDRPSGDVLMVQDDIAGQVTKALTELRPIQNSSQAPINPAP